MTEFQLRTAESWRNPYPMYRAMRDDAPVFHVADNGEGEDYFVLSRHSDIFSAVVDTSKFTSAKGLTPSYSDMAMHGDGDTPIVMMDGPEHLELRRVTLEQFKPRRLAALVDTMRDFVVERLDQLVEAGSGDIIKTLCKPLPSLYVALSLGVPLSDRELFDDWAWKIASASARGDLMSSAQALVDMMEYFNAMIVDRRQNPRDDLFSTLIHTKLDDGSNLSDGKILGVGFTMVLGGNDTTTGLLGGTVEYLTRFPDQRKLLAERPDLRRNAVQEFLRLSSPVQGLARTAIRDIDLHDVTIPSGRKVLMLYGSANRDERVYGTTADACDIERDIKKHVAFSAGPHACIGAAAARMQTEIFLEELFIRCPDFVADHDAGNFAEGHFVRRYDSMPFATSGF